MEERTIHLTDWLTLVIGVCVFLLAILHYNFPKRFSAFLLVPANKAYFTDFEKDKSNPIWYRLLLESMMTLGLSLFIYLISENENAVFKPDGHIVYIKILLVALLFINVQRFFHSLTGVLFDMKKGFSLFVEIKDSYIQWSTPILIALSVLAVYSTINKSVLIYIGVAILALMYLAGITKASLVVKSKNLNGLQLFFYLCALELLPVLVLVKLVA